MRQQMLMEEVEGLRARSESIEGALTKVQPIDMFHTPDNMKELEDWLNLANDPMVTTAAMMMWNLMANNISNIIDNAPPLPERSMKS